MPVAPPPVPAPGTSWGIVVPVKRLAVAKSRLAAYGDPARQALALAFACDVVVAALGCPGVDRVVVVTDDDAAGRAVKDLGADVVPDDPDAGLNPALEHGAELVRGPRPGTGVASLSADLPALRPADLRAALVALPPGARGFVPDSAGTGTTLLAAAPGTALAPAYGAGSRARHLASGAVELPGTPALHRDVDTPEDLRAALALGVGAHTAAVAAGLPLRPATRGRR